MRSAGDWAELSSKAMPSGVRPGRARRVCGPVPQWSATATRWYCVGRVWWRAYLVWDWRLGLSTRGDVWGSGGTELDGDAERSAAGTGPAGVRAGAPMVADGDEIELRQAPLLAVVIDVALEFGFVTARGFFGIGIGSEECGPFEAELDLGG